MNVINQEVVVVKIYLINTKKPIKSNQLVLQNKHIKITEID